MYYTINEQQQLYFIAIMLPAEIDEEITIFKNDMALRFGSKKALRTASHITLKAPFQNPAAMHENLLQWFGQMNITVASFIQEIKDFGAFNNKRNPVIYVEPVINESLRHLQQEVLQLFAEAFPGEVIGKNESRFSPHITIAYRDLQPRMFKEAWKEYAAKQYAASFTINAFQLLQHKNGRWNVVSHFPLPVRTMEPQRL